MNLEDVGCGWVISQFSFRFFFAFCSPRKGYDVSYFTRVDLVMGVQ